MTQYSGIPQSRRRANNPDPVAAHQQDEKDFVLEDYSNATSDDDNTEWEDEEQTYSSNHPRSSANSVRNPTTRNGARPSLRKRRKATLPKHIHQETPLSSAPQSPKSTPNYVEDGLSAFISAEEVYYGARKGLFFTAQYTFDVFKTVIHLLRPLFAFLIFLMVLSFIVTRIQSTLHSTFYPICYVPGVSKTPFCRLTVPTAIPVGQKQVKWADFSKLVNVQSKTFEHLLGESVGGPALSTELQSARMATRDLTVLVKHSTLPNKDSIAGILRDLIVDAKIAADELGKLTAKVGGSVDSILAANEWALSRIEAARANEPSPWSLRGVVPWMRPKQTLEKVITNTFGDAMDILSTQMERLIHEAGNNLQNLNNLEERLTTLYDVYYRENTLQSAAKDKLLAELWTILGGNRNEIRSFNKNLVLLENLAVYRKDAMRHVVATLTALRDMRDEMEDMRERAATPALLGENVPVEVHIKSIKLGLERLNMGRIEAKKQERAMSHEVELKRGL